jgi:hypothetical protein
MIRPLAIDNQQITYEEEGDWDKNEKDDEELHNLIIRGGGSGDRNKKRRTSITLSAIIAIIAAIGATSFIFIFIVGHSSSEQATLLEQEQKHNSSINKTPIDGDDTQQSDYEEQSILTETLFDPQIVWLASFPNSGTSFTMSMVTRATNTSFATNYGLESNYGLRDTPSLPIYGPDHPEGPFMPDPITSYHHKQLPYGRYVITKTHCGGYCFNCGPKEYAYGYNNSITSSSSSSSSSISSAISISKNTNATTGGSINSNKTAPPIPIASQPLPPPPLSFLHDCASGHAVDDHGNLIDVSYPPERVSKVIHLIRNPFHNVIARFHLERKHHRDDNTTKDQLWLENHPDNGIGMSLFCDEIDAIQVRGDKESDFFTSDYFLKNESNEEKDEEDIKVSFTSALRNGDGDHHDATIPGSPSSSKEWNNIINNVPCRGDFFRYVQWHNLLHESLDYLPTKLPVLTVYYENYQQSTFIDTAQSILEFLDLEAVPGDKRGNIKWSKFESRKDYDSFFTSEQKHYIKMFLTTLSSSRVRNDIKHYL